MYFLKALEIAVFCFAHPAHVLQVFWFPASLFVPSGTISIDLNFLTFNMFFYAHFSQHKQRDQTTPCTCVVGQARQVAYFGRCFRVIAVATWRMRPCDIDKRFASRLFPGTHSNAGTQWTYNRGLFLRHGVLPKSKGRSRDLRIHERGESGWKQLLKSECQLPVIWLRRRKQ